MRSRHRAPARLFLAAAPWLSVAQAATAGRPAEIDRQMPQLLGETPKPLCQLAGKPARVVNTVRQQGPARQP